MISERTISIGRALLTVAGITACGPPGSDEAPAVQSATQVASGPVGPVISTADDQPEAMGKPVPDEWRAHSDRAFGYTLLVHPGFVASPQDVDRLRAFTPSPVASTFFMNPTMAAGDLAGIEPPDLEVRVYSASKTDSLESWLTRAGFAYGNTGTRVKPQRVGDLNGVHVCESTLIAPGCSTYVLHGERVYQLTAISQEGEAMAATFRAVAP